ncbi:MAG: recombinase family protein [Methylococcales bacterium]|jgi:DNA invertase Pin-like site-specific DNA recombinase|nr:recombinase family protein [Methylococcales bacterium]
MIFNYRRVSTVIQNTDRQLLDVPCDREYEDKLSGKDTNRPQFLLMMANLREGDIINVHSLDRVGRNTKDILEIVQQVKDKGCLIHFHKENLKFDGTKSDLYSDLLLTILAGFSEFERSIILERQREGIAIAKAKGVYTGRRKKLSVEQLEEMKLDFNAGVAKTKIAEKYGVTRAYVYQLVNG